MTWQGDVLSLGAAVAIIGYMHIGSELRKTMPLFLYAFPVTATSAAFSSFAAVVVGEPLSVATRGAETVVLGDVFGWALAWPPRVLWRRFAVVAYLALGPGLIGHTGYNAALRHVSPLVVSTALALEPALGSALGWGLGVADAPGAQTCLGGAAVVCAVATVIVASARRHQGERGER